MIYDFMNQMHRYLKIDEALASLSPLLKMEWEDGSYCQDGLGITVSTYKTQQFSHIFKVAKEKTVFYTVLEGSEMVVTSYRNQSIQTSDAKTDLISVEGKGISNIIQAKPDRFMLFLPGELFCTSLRVAEQDSWVRSMMIRL